ncbi:MAG: hypothetical protein JWN80_1699 [Microbacteriaceae bacterium]|jgi:hypothetical protein|nr:hypothetical protein [Microbacteriaceae bacterium]
MTYRIDCAAVLTGTAQGIWNTWTDMVSYPSWDPREEAVTIDGPFAEGVTGFSKQVGPRAGSTFRITRVDPITGWTNECPLPGGRLVIEHGIRDDGDGTVHVAKSYEVYGPMSVLFRLFFARGIRSEAPSTFAALETEARRRASAK